MDTQRQQDLSSHAQAGVNSPAPAVKVLLTIEEFKFWYGIGHTKTYELLNDGLIEAVRAGRRTLIKRASADAYVAGLPRYAPAHAA